MAEEKSRKITKAREKKVYLSGFLHSILSRKKRKGRKTRKKIYKKCAVIAGGAIVIYALAKAGVLKQGKDYVFPPKDHISFNSGVKHYGNKEKEDFQLVVNRKDRRKIQFVAEDVEGKISQWSYIVIPGKDILNNGRDTFNKKGKGTLGPNSFKTVGDVYAAIENDLKSNLADLREKVVAGDVYPTAAKIDADSNHFYVTVKTDNGSAEFRWDKNDRKLKKAPQLVSITYQISNDKVLKIEIPDFQKVVKALPCFKKQTKKTINGLEKAVNDLLKKRREEFHRETLRALDELKKEAREGHIYDRILRDESGSSNSNQDSQNPNQRQSYNVDSTEKQYVVTKVNDISDMF